jgi:hypothetical protein
MTILGRIRRIVAGRGGDHCVGNCGTVVVVDDDDGMSSTAPIASNANDASPSPREVPPNPDPPPPPPPPPDANRDDEDDEYDDHPDDEYDDVRASSDMPPSIRRCAMIDVVRRDVDVDATRSRRRRRMSSEATATAAVAGAPPPTPRDDDADDVRNDESPFLSSSSSSSTSNATNMTNATTYAREEDGMAQCAPFPDPSCGTRRRRRGRGRGEGEEEGERRQRVGGRCRGGRGKCVGGGDDAAVLLPRPPSPPRGHSHSKTTCLPLRVGTTTTYHDALDAMLGNLADAILDCISGGRMDDACREWTNVPQARECKFF